MTTEETPIVNLEKAWPENTHRGDNLYLYWDKKKDSDNHGHVFLNKRWYYNIKCNNNRGNDRIRHTVSNSKKSNKTKREIKENWRKECPEFIQKKNKRTHKKRDQKRKSLIPRP